MYYFRNPAAEISYAETGYIRTDWHLLNASVNEVRGIYEHVLQAMQRYHATSLLCVYAHRPTMHKEVEAWLLQNWIPRAVHEAGYHRCAVVEPHATTKQATTLAKSLGAGESLEYELFDSVEEAESWLERTSLVAHP
jgi:hypothetical protein